MEPREWRTSAPEEQGIDSRSIVAMFEEIADDGKPVHSVLIARHGHLVTEAYVSPFRSADRHILYSATKSITALLIGLAIDDGLIGDETTPVLDLLPEYRGRIANSDPRKERLQLRHLLTMTDGISWQDWPYGIRGAGDFSRLLGSEDGVRYVLDRPMAATPGTRYNYNSGASHLLAAIVQKVSGKTALQYARERLFAPLGIHDVAWSRYQGVNNGGSELFLEPRDFARLGIAILQRGRWNGRQVLPAEWVRKSIAPLVTSEPGLGERYGYGWYTKPFAGHAVHSAEGLGGNFLFVVPDLDLVVVFTGGLTGRDMTAPYRFLARNIMPAAAAAAPLPPNPESNASLARLLARLAAPEPSVAPVIPEPARAAAGRTFMVTDRQNLLGLARFRLTLPRDGAASLDLVYSGTGRDADWGVDPVFRTDELSADPKELHLEVGLDGRYRTVMVHHPEIGSVALSAKGRWRDERTLVLEVISGWAIPETWTIAFDGAAGASLSVQQLFFETSVTGRAPAPAARRAGRRKTRPASTSPAGGAGRTAPGASAGPTAGRAAGRARASGSLPSFTPATEGNPLLAHRV